jgi:acyl-coenzyme A thioesterase PaaI-like protein
VSEDDRLVIAEMGLVLARDGEYLAGRATVVDELNVPGRRDVRATAFAIWADVIGAAIASARLAPRAATTVDLTLDLCRPVSGVEVVEARAHLVKAGRQMITTAVEFSDEDGHLLGFATLGLMAAPDGTMHEPGVASRNAITSLVGRLPEPLGVRVGCERLEGGVARMPKSARTTNALNTINGGLHSLLVEESMLSLDPQAHVISMTLRYLRPARVGPAIATATLAEGLGRVTVVDAGAGGREVVLATVRCV